MQDVWSKVQGSLRKQLGPQNYEIWIEPITMGPHLGSVVQLLVPNIYYRDWVRDNYGEVVTQELRHHLGDGITVEYEIRDSDNGDDPEGEAAQPASDDAFASTANSRRPRANASDGRSPRVTPGISSDKTFLNFVVGACNQFAHAAAQAVAEVPGEPQYNPLFIYGSTGLGKTHLMHAIGNAMRAQDPSTRVLYVTAERFTNELIDALRYRRMPDFRDKFRKNTDVLLIDDVQFLSGKERTQEELFHTFEFLKERGKQIVFTADVLPREISGLEPRLRTRCESGMIADTQPPDVETMLAILRQKSDDMGLQLDNELAQWLSTRVRGSIRELEGVLNRLKAVCDLEGIVRPTIELAREHLGSILPNAPAPPTADEIIQTVASFHGLKSSDLKGSRRLKQIVRPRHIAMFLVRKNTDLSFPDIGRAFGGKDHATVQHACKKVRLLLDKEPDLLNTIETIERMLVR